jgi:hypothetical protein
MTTSAVTSNGKRSVCTGAVPVPIFGASAMALPFGQTAGSGRLRFGSRAKRMRGWEDSEQAALDAARAAGLNGEGLAASSGSFGAVSRRMLRSVPSSPSTSISESSCSWMVNSPANSAAGQPSPSRDARFASSEPGVPKRGRSCEGRTATEDCSGMMPMELRNSTPRDTGN